MFEDHDRVTGAGSMGCLRPSQAVVAGSMGCLRPGRRGQGRFDGMFEAARSLPTAGSMGCLRITVPYRGRFDGMFEVLHLLEGQVRWDV